MKKLLMGSVMVTALGLFVVSLPAPTIAQSARTRPNTIQDRVDARFEVLIEQLCNRMAVSVKRGLSNSMPDFCAPELTPPPADVCPNVPGDQASGPCADVECEENDGTWNGNSCDLPPPPQIDVCPNVPGIQESGPCADVECDEDGGVWNGESCDMPTPLPGKLMVNEIMYDLMSGSDSNREWVEVWNGTDSSIDLFGWKFSESGGNHVLTSSPGLLILPSGGFAVIVASTTTFMADWPSFSGTLIDVTSFTLTNVGETIGVKNSLDEIVDEVTYSSSQGAGGDGNSLQRTTDGDWIAAPPTPGAENAPDASPNSL